MHTQAEVWEGRVGLDGVAMVAIINRGPKLAYAYCLTTLLNLGIFSIVLCNLLLFRLSENNNGDLSNANNYRAI